MGQIMRSKGCFGMVIWAILQSYLAYMRMSLFTNNLHNVIQHNDGTRERSKTKGLYNFAKSIIMAIFVF